MSSHTRYIITNNDNTWFANIRLRNKNHEFFLEPKFKAETKDKLWTNMKNNSNAVRHYRRRGEWVVLFENQTKAVPVKQADE